MPRFSKLRTVRVYHNFTIEKLHEIGNILHSRGIQENNFEEELNRIHVLPIEYRDKTKSRDHKALFHTLTQFSRDCSFDFGEELVQYGRALVQADNKGFGRREFPAGTRPTPLHGGAPIVAKECNRSVDEPPRSQPLSNPERRAACSFRGWKPYYSIISNAIVLQDEKAEEEGEGAEGCGYGKDAGQEHERNSKNHITKIITVTTTTDYDYYRVMRMREPEAPYVKCTTEASCFSDFIIWSREFLPVPGTYISDPNYQKRFLEGRTPIKPKPENHSIFVTPQTTDDDADDESDEIDDQTVSGIERNSSSSGEAFYFCGRNYVIDLGTESEPDEDTASYHTGSSETGNPASGDSTTTLTKEGK